MPVGWSFGKEKGCLAHYRQGTPSSVTYGCVLSLRCVYRSPADEHTCGQEAGPDDG
jgi:hypothetical protein